MPHLPPSSRKKYPTARSDWSGNGPHKHLRSINHRGYQLDPKPALYLSGHTDKDPRQKLKEQNIEKLRPRSYLFEWIVCVGFHEIKRDHREYDQCNDCCNELYLFFIFHLFHFITSNFSNSSSATKFCKKNVPKCFSVTTTRYILAHLFFN